MYWITTDVLVDKFRTGRFDSSEVGPYFFANVLLQSVGFILPGMAMSAWDFFGGVAAILITIGGVLHLKEQNGGTFGKGYLERYFSLGWVTGVRLILVGIPAAVVFFGLAAVLGGDDSMAPAGAVFFVLLLFAWYRYTGMLFAESQEGFEAEHVA
jgi:hypothetical protein